MFVFRDKLKKIDMGGGVIRQYLGEGQNMNAQHWDIFIPILRSSSVMLSRAVLR